MSHVLRVGELKTEAAALLSLLQTNLSPFIDGGRMDWLYRLGPHGEAKVWVAVEESTGRLVGAASVFPRKLYLNGELVNGFVLGDFCVAKEHRSMGLALRLQRKCLEYVQDGRFAAGYDLPSKSMLAIYQRIGMKAEGSMVRMVKLLRADEKIAARVSFGPAAKVMSGAVNSVLALGKFALRLRTSAELKLQQGKCQKEFTELANSIGNRLGTCVDRSAEYLNWRFLSHPQHKYEILTARYHGKLAGYLVFFQEGKKAAVADWFCQEPRKLRKDLIRGLVKLLNARGCESVHAAVLADHAYYSDLLSLGFRPRESSSVIFLRPNGEANAAAGNTNWLLMDGDREG